ncbi:MAG TPA: hypothetical protein VFI11_14645 [Anaerolineales bacterium]|nr:hypothetical protein [Anaerolineales bacterium]
MELPPLAALDAEADRLLEMALSDETLDSRRAAVMVAQLRAAATVVRRLLGEPLGFAQEVEEIYDHRPAWTDEGLFVEAHHRLDEALPGRGSLAERVASFRKSVTVSADRLRPVVQLILQRLQKEARHRFPLPTDERVEVEFVIDQPWSAYNACLGRGRSRVEIGLDWPQFATALADLVAHEAYPGHHTEHAIKEAEWIDGRAWDELRLVLLNSPLSVVSEGLATRALGIMIDRSAWLTWHAQEVFPAAGLSEIHPDGAWEFAVGQGVLMRCLGNAALLLLDQGRSRDEAAKYLTRYRLADEPSAHRSIAFILNPLVRGYIFNYWVGGDLIDPALQRSTNPVETFGRLLHDLMTPTSVRNLGADRTP